MKKTQSTRPIWSQAKIVLVSAGAAITVLPASLLAQWLIYDDWLHQTGPLRIVGTSIATGVTFLFALRWQIAIRERQLDMVRRMEMILQMNDRIRNALQAIECLTYVAQPDATESVRQSVNVIDSVLREVLAESGQPQPKTVDPVQQSIESSSSAITTPHSSSYWPYGDASIHRSDFVSRSYYLTARGRPATCLPQISTFGAYRPQSLHS